MQFTQLHPTSNSRLRLVFDYAVIVLKLAAGATYGDLAALCNTTAEHRGSATRQVAVTIEAAVPMAGRWLHSAVAGLAGQASPSLTSIPLYAFIPTFRQRNDAVSRH